MVVGKYTVENFLDLQMLLRRYLYTIWTELSAIFCITNDHNFIPCHFYLTLLLRHHLGRHPARLGYLWALPFCSEEKEEEKPEGSLSSAILLEAVLVKSWGFRENSK